MKIKTQCNDDKVSVRGGRRVFHSAVKVDS